MKGFAIHAKSDVLFRWVSVINPHPPNIIRIMTTCITFNHWYEDCNKKSPLSKACEDDGVFHVPQEVRDDGSIHQRE